MVMPATNFPPDTDPLRTVSLKPTQKTFPRRSAHPAASRRPSNSTRKFWTGRPISWRDS